MQNYEQLVQRISRSSGLSVEDITRRVEAKRAKLSGLISKEGAAQVVASELGISFDKEKIKVSEMLDGMKRVNVVGKIIDLSAVREYNKNGRQGKIGSFVLADDTGNIRTVLWDTNHISLIEQGKIKQDDVVEITNASMRNNELHLTGFSDIKLSNEIIKDVKSEKSLKERKIFDLKAGENAMLRAFIVQTFEPRFFNVCPSCSKKVNDLGECGEHGKVAAQKRSLLSLVLDDGSETIRAVLFSEQITKLLGENGAEKRGELLGKELFFSGQARQNKLFGNTEFFVNDSQEIDIDKLIEQLER